MNCLVIKKSRKYWCGIWKRYLESHGPLDRYVELRVAHAPGMLGTFSPPSGVSDPDMHYGTCVTHVPWCMPGGITGGFAWIRWREQHSLHYRRMLNAQYYVFGKMPIENDVILPKVESPVHHFRYKRYTVDSHHRWSLLSQFIPLRYFPNFTERSKHGFPMWHEVYEWQLSPQGTPVKFERDLDNVECVIMTSKVSRI